jgi:hypothetical protein
VIADIVNIVSKERTHRIDAEEIVALDLLVALKVFANPRVGVVT